MVMFDRYFILTESTYKDQELDTRMVQDDYLCEVHS